MSDSGQRIEYGEPGYWESLRKQAKPDRSTWVPIVLEPMSAITTTDCASARWYLENARRLGWAVRATRARHLQPPANSGNYVGRWAEYTTIAVRLLHKERSLSAWGVWQYDPEGGPKHGGQWSYDMAMWAAVLDWDRDGRRPGRIVILRSFAGTYQLAAEEFKAVVKGEPFAPKKKDEEGAKDAKPKAPRKPRKSAPRRVMA